MNYLICQDWINTTNNHAGIKYLCNTIAIGDNNYTNICIPSFNGKAQFVRNNFLKKFFSKIGDIRHSLYMKKITRDLIQTLNDGDNVFIMEYMDKGCPLLPIAKRIRNGKKTVRVYGMVHLVPAMLDKYYPTDILFNEWTDNADKILTLGHSLTNYLINRGVDESRVVTTFHYVDDYYRNQDVRTSDNITVIAMGNQMRNVKLLQQIVSGCPDVRFVICQGVNDLSREFQSYSNVQLIPFVEETVLRDYMKNADISINAMEDTIGSNVIVTSMAMGLAMVCSDVGSIHDYCDDENCVFCDNNNIEDFINAIQKLVLDKSLLKKMKKHSHDLALELSIENFKNDIEKKLAL